MNYIRKRVSDFLTSLYFIKNVFIRNILRKLISWIDGGQYYSTNLRKIMLKYHKVEIGVGTYGSCFNPNYTFPNIEIGKYTSVSSTCFLHTRNHPIHYVSTYPIFYNKALGVVREDKIKNKKLIIGNDCWLGQNAIILASCNNIGNGAVIGAGAIITKDIPPYAIVVGVPATVIGYRFDEEQIKKLEEIKWWDWDMNFIKEHYSKFDSIQEFIKFADKNKSEGNQWK